MGPKLRDIGWEHGTPLTAGDRRKVVCNYCNKIISGGITRFKEHLGHVSGNTEVCSRAPKEVTNMIKNLLNEGSKKRAFEKRNKEKLRASLRNENFYAGDDTEDEDEDEDEDEGGMTRLERSQLKHAVKESRQMARLAEEERRHSVSGPSTSGTKRPQLSRTWSVKDGVNVPTVGIDQHMFRPKKSYQKTVKGMFLADGVKKVGKAISKFFHFNAIPFNAADSGPYYQTMIDTIAEAGPGIKGPSAFQIGGVYLDEEVQETEVYINTLKAKWPEYGCTIMCDGWSSRTKKPIINFMIYSDRNMIYHTSVDTTNKIKSAEYICSLMDKVVEEVGESNVIQVVTDNEPNFKAAGRMLMEQRKHLFWSPCAAHCLDLMLEDIGNMKSIKSTLDDAKSITSFIYNSQKVVNLMKQHTNDRELLRPGITRFATEFIALESLIRHQVELKRMCTTNEWIEFNREKSRRSLAKKVAELILTDRFWQRAAEVMLIMEPLVLLLKVVDQDKKPTLSVIYQGMDMAKLSIKYNVSNWKKYWKVIDARWERQLHTHIHAAAYYLNPMFQYETNVSNDDEVRRGLKEVIKRLEPDIDKQVLALNEVRQFVTQSGEFGSLLTKKAVKSSLPAEWWYNYGESAPNLRRIAIKILSQTCSSSGCERNWSTWSLIHTKLRNRLAMKKLHKLVYVHYNMRLKVRNLMYMRNAEDYFNPIDLNNLFEDGDILDEWIRENDTGVLEPDDLAWLDEGIQKSEEESGGGGIRRKQPPRATVFSTDDDDDDDDDDNDDDNDGGGGVGRVTMQVTTSGGKGKGSAYSADSQHDGGMSWAKGNDDYYATQDTDHGYRPGISEQRRHLSDLTRFPSSDEYSSGHDPYSQRYRRIDDQLQNLNLGQQFGGYGYNYGYGSRRHSISGIGSSGSDPAYGGYAQDHTSSGGSNSSLAFRGGYYGTEHGVQNDRSSGSSNEYRGFGYYHHSGQPNFPDYGPSTHSFQPERQAHDSHLYPYPTGENQQPSLYPYRRSDADNFDLYRHSRHN